MATARHTEPIIPQQIPYDQERQQELRWVESMVRPLRLRLSKRFCAFQKSSPGQPQPSRRANTSARTKDCQSSRDKRITPHNLCILYHQFATYHHGTLLYTKLDGSADSVGRFILLSGPAPAYQGRYRPIHSTPPSRA
ncbi:hypothetical protein B2J93_8003 [Marssonina coronariae]|uniref:Uncharacterized protein n=1 Tax=Diplocarpon coronariae TaxID=2795749 RepID=A0A218ZB01_9HELO|nr:hypothetical protein B2J93_8003 [Marssonina coronariae]